MEKTTEIPRTRNREWGFFGTCASNGHTDPEAAWDEAMETLTDRNGMFRMEANDARELLDATWGRHLADQVALEDDLRAAIEDPHFDGGWMRHTRAFVRKHIGIGAPFADPMTREQAIAWIARRFLDLETLEARNSDEADFHQHAVWKIQQALEAAYEAGRQSAKRRGR